MSLYNTDHPSIVIGENICVCKENITMGGPELPTDPGHEVFPTPAVDHPRVGVESEDSDDPDAYEGYQPLAMDEGNEGIAAEEPRVQAPETEDGTADGDIDLLTAPVTHGDPNMPPIEAADVEIERQVWNEPRPKELQMELDKTRTDQVRIRESQPDMGEISAVIK